MQKLTYTVTRGNAAGTVLTPHVHADGQFVVSKTRFKEDYIRINQESELPEWLAKGYSIRMSDPDSPNYPPSLVSPKSIRGKEA